MVYKADLFSSREKVRFDLLVGTLGVQNLVVVVILERSAASICCLFGGTKKGEKNVRLTSSRDTYGCFFLWVGGSAGFLFFLLSQAPQSRSAREKKKTISFELMITTRNFNGDIMRADYRSASAIKVVKSR